MERSNRGRQAADPNNPIQSRPTAVWKRFGVKVTVNEAKLLKVLCQPESMKLSVKEICDQAGVHTMTYYRAMQSDNFKKLLPMMVDEIIKGNIVHIINSSIKAAKAGSYQDRRMLLEMAGMVEGSGSKVNVNTGTVKVQWIDERAGMKSIPLGVTEVDGTEDTGEAGGESVSEEVHSSDSDTSEGG